MENSADIWGIIQMDYLLPYRDIQASSDSLQRVSESDSDISYRLPKRNISKNDNYFAKDKKKEDNHFSMSELLCPKPMIHCLKHCLN